MKKILSIVLALMLIIGAVPFAMAEDAQVAIILKALGNPFWETMKKGIEDKAAELGVQVDIFAANSEEDVEGQLLILENAIGKGYKAIGVAPLSPTNLNNAIAQAMREGIYVINIDEKVDIDALKALGGNVMGFTTTDNVAVGKIAGDDIVASLPEGGKVAIIEGKAGNASGKHRADGAKSAFDAAENIELVESQPADWDRTKAYDVATNYITKHPDLKAIYCCNDTMAMGALEAVKASNLDILVYGTDGNPDAVASVEAGELTGTVAQDPAGIGARAFELLLSYIETGAAIDLEAEVPVEYVDAFLIKKQ
ncbi:MAG: D-allose transporter substrate-binding protein [Christensenellaceae bacterium]|nr:D-allose transporter substrate-binding protein [Christensenellaceae bacterium]